MPRLPNTDLRSGLRSPWLVAPVAVVVAVLLVVVGRDRAAPAAAATPVTTADTVTVSGVGTADGAPDTLTVDFTVHAARADVQSTLDTVAAEAKRVLAALHKAGVLERNLRTSDLQLDRNYNNHGVPIGYTSSETIEARITPLADAGRTISSAADATPHVDIGNLGFDIAHDDQLVRQARSNAFADAKSRASQYASLAGRPLGQVQSIRETVQAPPSYPYPGSFDAAGVLEHRAPVPIRGGRQSLTVRVTVVWALR